MFEDGYIERLIRQVGQIVARSTVGRADIQHAVTPEEIDAAWSELLGIPEGLLDVIDAPTLARLLGSPAQQRLGADLLEADAAARAATDPVGAERRLALARALRDHFTG
jgi:hypothetical protein